MVALNHFSAFSFMKFITKSLIIFFLLAGVAFSQEKVQYATFGFAYATPLPLPSKLLVDGKDYRPRGLLPGNVIRGGALKAGNYQFTLENEQATDCTVQVSALPGKTPLLVGYMDEKTSVDGEKISVLQILPIPPSPGAQEGFYGLYVGRNPQKKIQTNKGEFLLNRLEPQFLFSGNQIALIPETKGDDNVFNCFRMEGTGVFYLVVFENQENQLAFCILEEDSTSEEREE